MKQRIIVILLALMLLSAAGCAAAGTASQNQATPAIRPGTDATAQESLPNPDETPFPTLPPVIDGSQGGGAPVVLGFQWKNPYQSQPSEVDFGTMSGDEAYQWYMENGTLWYIANAAGDCLEINPWGPKASGKTTMELLNTTELTGLEPWVYYQVPYSPDFRFSATRDDRPWSVCVRWEDGETAVEGSHTGDLRITTAGVYMDGKGAYADAEEPMAFSVTVKRGQGQRQLKVTGADCEAFLLSREGEGFHIAAQGECAIIITDYTDGKETVLLSETLPAGSRWYVEDLLAEPDKLVTGFLP